MAVPTFEGVALETTSQCDRSEQTTATEQASHEQRPESPATSSAETCSPSVSSHS